jgi:flagellar assembly factor FliW
MIDAVQTTTVMLPKFGELTYAPTDVIEFPWGLPGFAEHRRWLLLTLDSHPSFVWLQSLDDVKIAIPTADPYLIFETYDPKLPAYAFVALDVNTAEDFTMLCVVVVTDNAREMTMNLMAPIVVNLRTRRARQIMLENSGYSVKEPIPRKAAQAPSGEETAATP